MASVQPDEINLDDLNNNEEGASVSDSESGAGAVPGDNEGDGGAGAVPGNNEGDGVDDEEDESGTGTGNADARTEEERELFRSLKKRYHFMSEKFFELKDAKYKSTESKEVTLRFRCRLCPSRYSTDANSLSNLRRHIARKHDSSLQQYEDLWSNHKRSSRMDEGPSAKKPKAQNKMSEFFKPKRSGNEWHPIVTQGQLDRAVVHFVVDCNAPYSYVDNEKFKALVLLGK